MEISEIDTFMVVKIDCIGDMFMIIFPANYLRRNPVPQNKKEKREKKKGSARKRTQKKKIVRKHPV